MEVFAKTTVDTTTLTKKQWEYIIQIDAYLQDCKREIEKSNKFLKNDHYAITNISESINCCRKTIYNSTAARQFIEHYPRAYSIEIELSEKILSLEKEIHDLESQVSLMKLRDHEWDKLKKDHAILKDVLKSSLKENDMLRKNVLLLQREVARQEKKKEISLTSKSQSKKS